MAWQTPKPTCCCLLSGIECPRSSRNMPGGVQVAEPFSDEAMQFTKELVLQREVSWSSRASWIHVLIAQKSRISGHPNFLFSHSPSMFTFPCLSLLISEEARHYSGSKTHFQQAACFVSLWLPHCERYKSFKQFFLLCADIPPIIPRSDLLCRISTQLSRFENLIIQETLFPGI